MVTASANWGNSFPRTYTLPNSIAQAIRLPLGGTFEDALTVQRAQSLTQLHDKKNSVAVTTVRKVSQKGQGSKKQAHTEIERIH